MSLGQNRYPCCRSPSVNSSSSTSSSHPHRHHTARRHSLVSDPDVEKEKLKAEHESSKTRKLSEQIIAAQNSIKEKKKEDYLNFLKKQEAELDEKIKPSNMSAKRQNPEEATMTGNENEYEEIIERDIFLAPDITYREPEQRRYPILIPERRVRISHDHHHYHQYKQRAQNQPPVIEAVTREIHSRPAHHHHGDEVQVRSKHRTRSHSLEHGHTHASHGRHRNLWQWSRIVEATIPGAGGKIETIRWG